MMNSSIEHRTAFTPTTSTPYHNKYPQSNFAYHAPLSVATTPQQEPLPPPAYHNTSYMLPPRTPTSLMTPEHSMMQPSLDTCLKVLASVENRETPLTSVEQEKAQKIKEKLALLSKGAGAEKPENTRFVIGDQNDLPFNNSKSLYCFVYAYFIIR